MILICKRLYDLKKAVMNFKYIQAHQRPVRTLYIHVCTFDIESDYNVRRCGFSNLISHECLIIEQ